MDRTMKAATNTMNEDAPLPLSALQLIAPPLRLMSAAMWKVMLQRDAVHYGKLEETITSLCETVPGLLHYRHQARLTMGLRALMILEELRQSDPPDAQLILQALHKLQDSSIPIGKRKDQKVEEAKRNFQTLVNSLLKNAAARKQFFKEFHLHYGGNYVASLEKLLWEFLIRLDKLLPVPDLAQTVSWLSGAPAVLEECARSVSQPQLLRTLLQHERCLGHLGSASLLSSTGDAILSSLSLPLSGRVLQTIQSESTRLSNTVTNPTPSTPRTTRRSARETQSQVTPVIGCISNDILQKNNEKVASSGQEVETASELSRNTRSKQRSSSNKEILEKDLEKEYFVGNMLVTVISQSSGSEVEEEEEGSKEEINSRKGSSERAIKLPKKTEIKNRNGKREQDDTRKCSTRRSSEDIESQQEAEMSALLISCMKRQLRVVIPRLNDNDLPVCPNHLSSEEKENTKSPCQPSSKDSVGNSDSVMRKRKFTDLSSTPTPEKHMTLSVNRPTSTCSPSIPLVLHLPVCRPDTPTPSVNSSDDIIGDSDDERADSVKRKVFSQQYCKTKNGTYVPTLREFWNPVFCSTLSPGSRH
ncbi:TERF1-interacting nuclear factor 2 isoform X2 [Onychostoma macrolepis]|uniref:TERF1-interacting nuclear factor 2 isoform X2 n=1 Tax=Onychostoma macrolepis TaxID=369639 RepID=UPI00272D3DF6|nr:TERF1-interacting nuclear factor 2 isoform X2 [Onychostoma macrolepis]